MGNVGDKNFENQLIMEEKFASKKKDYVGERIGKLVVQRYAGYQLVAGPFIKGKQYYNKFHYYQCQCDCGSTPIYVREQRLKHGITKSCSCCAWERSIGVFNDKIRRGEAKPNITNITHGDTGKALYIKWRSMRDRCYNPNNKSYDRYGGRGIKVCDEWMGDEGYFHFRSWAYKNGYNENIPGLSIDRINNDGNYEPSNCRFVNSFVQANNRSTSKPISFYGTEYTEAELARRFGIDNTTFSSRIRHGWTINEAIQLPPIPGIDKYQYIASHQGCVQEKKMIIRPIYFIDHPKIDPADPKLQYGITPEQLDRARGITKDDNERELKRRQEIFEQTKYMK